MNTTDHDEEHQARNTRGDGVPPERGTSLRGHEHDVKGTENAEGTDHNSRRTARNGAVEREVRSSISPRP